MTDRRHGWIRTGLIIFGIWTAYALFCVYQSYLTSRYVSDHQRPWRLLIGLQFEAMWIWAAFTPLIMWVARRFPFTKERWGTSLVVHFVSCLLFATLDVAIATELAPIIGAPSRDRHWYQNWLIWFDGNFFGYLSVVAITHAVDYRRGFRERQRRATELEIKAAQLETQLGRAELEVLKMRLQPHFLFNTLHAISELVHEDPRAADRMVTRLGDLLRMSLEDDGQQEVPLRQEIAFVNAYVEIEKARHGERLNVDMAIDSNTLDARVPHLILQPLVENAIRHGVVSSVHGCRVRVGARRNDGKLEIEIADDGPGLSEAPAAIREGVGLQNTRARLQVLYGDAHVLQLSNRSEGGARVRLTLPYHDNGDGRLNPPDRVVHMDGEEHPSLGRR